MIPSSPELQLLVCCARRDLSVDDEARLVSLITQGVEWPRLIALALRHKMMPLLWWHLRTRTSHVPAQVAADLKAAFGANARNMLRLTAELRELVAFFADHGIEVVPYKGPALGERLYGNLALRQAGDLDVVVSLSQCRRAKALLMERGYAPRHVLSAGGEAFMFRSRYSEEFARPDGLRVELHWGFTNRDLDLPLHLDDLRPRLTPMPLGGAPVPMFGTEDMLLILCVHGCKHRWDRLEWLCGVGELMRSPGDTLLDWERVLREARRYHCERMVLLGVLLAHDMLDAPVPPMVLARARADDTVAELARQVPPLLLTESVDGDTAGNLATDIFRLRLRERTRDQIRFVWYRLTTPSRPESWRALTVGDVVLPLHGILRPFRVLSKLPRAALRLRQGSRPE
jgi:Uncharacterised nucleotidyltransferase